jgi:PAS domain S-box-containing protein
MRGAQGNDSHEAARLQTLREHAVLDTAPEDVYDGVVDVAAQLCRAPVAVLSFVDAEREWVKAGHGADLHELPRAGSFGGAAIAAPDAATVVPDTAADARFAAHPWVAGAPGARFYAAVPLLAGSGTAIGALAVMDTRPRDDGDRLVASLCSAARIAQGALARRREAALGGALTCVVDFEGRFIRVSPAWSTLLGVPAETMVGRRLSDFVHPDDAAITSDELEVTRHGPGSSGFENRYRRPDGQVRWLLWSSHGVPEEGRVFAVARDITVQKAGEMALRESERRYRCARDAAERADAAKSEFLARMSHELRTPLNAVMGFAQLLQLDDLNEEQLDAVARILRGGRHLLSVVEDVLDISRIEAGELDVQIRPVAVPALVDEVVALLEPLAAERGISLVTDTRACHSPAAADSRRLEQVLLNLVSNAIKYGPAGSEVVARARSEGERVLVSVIDEGPGVPPHEAERVFMPFERLPGREKVQGTGLGLALSRNLAHAMGAEIGVRPHGSGSEFWVDLPQARARPAGPATAQDSFTSAPSRVSELS